MSKIAPLQHIPKLYETEKEINITAKQTEVKIKVKAEDGSTKTHKLIIEGLPDDTTIKEVIINGHLSC